MSFVRLFTIESVRNFRGLFSSGYFPVTEIFYITYSRHVTLSEDDLEEKFMKGFGKGGQKVNKTSNCVELRHLPTGITVKCHQTRYLERNRSIAREILKEKLDYFYNNKESSLAKKWAKIRKRKANYVRKRSIKNEILELSKNSQSRNKDDINKTS